MKISVKAHGRDMLVLRNVEKRLEDGSEGMMDMDGEIRDAINLESAEMDNETEKKFISSSYSKDEKWVQEYIEQFGIELSFF